MDASTAANYTSDGLMSPSMYSSQSAGSTVNCFIKPSMLMTPIDEATDSSSSSFFSSPSFGDEFDFLASTGNIVTSSSTPPISSSKASSTLLTVSVSSVNNNNEQASHHLQQQQQHQHVQLTAQHHHQQQQHHSHHIPPGQQASHLSNSMDEGLTGPAVSSNNNPGNCDVNSSYNNTCNSNDLGDPLMMNHGTPSHPSSFHHTNYSSNGYIEYTDSPFYPTSSEDTYHVSTSSFSPDSNGHHHQHLQQQQQPPPQQHHHHHHHHHQQQQQQQQQMHMNGRDGPLNQNVSFPHSSSNFYANHQVNSQANMHMQPQHLQVDHQSPYFNHMSQIPTQQQPFYPTNVNVKSEFVANNELMCKSEGSPAARSVSTPSSTASSSSLIESPSFYESSNFKVTGLPCNGPVSNLSVLSSSSSSSSSPSTGGGSSGAGKSTAGLSTKGRHNLTSGAGPKGPASVLLVQPYHHHQHHQQQQQQQPPQQQQSHPHLTGHHVHLHHQSVSPPTSTSSPGANCKREKKTGKKRKDPNEPQKPVSAYALFFRDTQATIKGSQPNASFGEVSKIVAAMWDQLEQEAKTAYKNRTEQAKKEYLKALAVYRASQLPSINGTAGLAGGTSSLTSPNGPVRNSLTGPLQVNGHHLHHSQARDQTGQPSHPQPPPQPPQQQQQQQQQQQPGHQQPSPLQKRSPLLTSALQASSAAMSINPSDLEPSSPGSSSFNSYNNNGHNKQQQSNTTNCTGSNSICSNNDQRIINSSSSSSQQPHYVTDHQQQQQQQNWTPVNGTGGGGGGGGMSASSSSSSPSSSSPSNWPDHSSSQLMSSVTSSSNGSSSNNNNYTNGPNVSLNINSTVSPMTVSTATYTTHHSHTHHPVMAQVNSV